MKMSVRRSMSVSFYMYYICGLSSYEQKKGAPVSAPLIEVSCG